MAERQVTVASASGLHARPAALFAQAAGALDVPVTVRRLDETTQVPANKMLQLLTLDIVHGDQVILQAEGPGAEDALQHLGDLLETDLDAQLPSMNSSASRSSNV